MLLRSPEDVLRWLDERLWAAGVAATILTNGQRPGDPRPMQVRGIGLFAPGAQATAFVPATAVEAMQQAASLLRRAPIYVADAYEEQLAFSVLHPGLLSVAGDLVLTNALLKPRLPTLVGGTTSTPKTPTPANLTDDDLLRMLGSLLPALWDDVQDARESLQTYTQHIPYETELYATLMLARAAAQGYRIDEPTIAAGRVYPTWRTTHPSGSGNITAAGPPLTSVTAAGRRAYTADKGHRWVQIAWTDPEVAILAGRTGSSWLKQAALRAVSGESAYAALAELWNVTLDEARTAFRVLLTTGPDEILAEGKGVFAGMTRELAQVAPEWVEWGARLRREAEEDRCLRSFMGRFITVDEPRKACALDVQVTQAMLLKMLMARIGIEAQLDRDLWAGFSCPIPVYSKLAYQIDTHVPLSRHVPAALRASLLFVATNMPLLASVSMGPSWGQLTLVTTSKQSQAEQELLSPAALPFRCPLCEGVAADEATLREHAVAIHGVVDLDGFVKTSTLVQEDA